MSKFFTYHQNNSGGVFNKESAKGIGATVIIEAEGSEQANQIAIQKGLYFNGCSDGIDCICCGDRWYEAGNSDANDIPSIYGESILTSSPSFYRVDVYIHYLNGSIMLFDLDTKVKTFIEGKEASND